MRANDLTKQNQLLLTQIAQQDASSANFEQLTETERLLALALTKSAAEATDQFNEYLFATGNASLSSQKDPESVQQKKDLRRQWDKTDGGAFMQSVNALQKAIERQRNRIMTFNGSGGFALDSVREE